MKGNCYGCKHAIEQRDHIREGEQVRCAMAEKLFGTDLKGGKRWVDVRRSKKTGKLLNAKCGTFDEITPQDFEEAPAQKVVVKAGSRSCPICKGSGMSNYKVSEVTMRSKCNRCNGKGEI